MSVRALSLVLAIAAAGLGVAPVPAEASFKAIWGPTVRDGVDQFPIYRELGVSIYEADLSWNAVAQRQPHHPTSPRDPAYAWPADLAQSIADAKRNHIRVMLQIIGTPSWANGGRDWNWAPTSSRSFAAFATAAARKYPGVHLWMIWGEPSRAPNFQPLTKASPGTRLDAAQRRAPHTYARMLDASYGALKAVSGKNRVIGGGTYTTGDIDTQQWIQNLRLPNGKPPRMDMYAHNPFSFRKPDFSNPPSPSGMIDFSDLPRLAKLVDRYLHRGLPLFLSEWTVPTGRDQEFNFYVDPPVAADWVRAALQLMRDWHRIYALGWIHVYDDPTSSGGLLTVDGVRKPTFAAFANG